MDRISGWPSCEASHETPAGRAHGTAPVSNSPCLKLVSNALVLGGVAVDVPSQWRDAINGLIAFERTEICWAPAPQHSGIRAMRRLTGKHEAAQGAPLFAPWQARDPADLQAPANSTKIPRGHWLTSYLFDCGADRPATRPIIDLMVASAHPSACLPAEDCDVALPRGSALSAIFDAIFAERRCRIAMITPQRTASAMARRLLASGRATRRADCKIEILTIEDALGALMAGAPAWDAIIVAPQLRSIVLAILGEATGLTGPHPLLWHNRSLTMIGCETLRPWQDHQPLDAALLAQSLALAARHGGQMPLAQRLFSGWARLRESGAATPSRGSAAPYATILDEAEMIARIPAVWDARGRPGPVWQALGPQSVPQQGNQPASNSVGLKLVASQ